MFTVGAIHQAFLVGAHIRGNFYDGRLVRDGIPTEVLVQKFSTLEIAKTYIQNLRRLGDCPYIAKGYDYAEDLEVQGQGLAFIQKLDFFDDEWLNNEQKSRMWNVEGNRIIGDEFKRVFRNIGLGLENLNRANIAHGNLLNNGVMMDGNGNIKLLNFDYTRAGLTGNNQVIMPCEDLIQFELLINEAVRNHPPTHPYPAGENDLSCFHHMCNFQIPTTDSPSDFINDYSSWIYQLSLYWTDSQIFIFLEMMNNLLDANSHNLDPMGFLRYFHGWSNVVTRNNRMNICYSYRPNTDMYQFAFGILRFLWNFKEHPNGGRKMRDADYMSPAEAVKFVLNEFHALVGVTYHDIYSLRFEMTSSQYGPVSLRLKTFQFFCWSTPGLFVHIPMY